MTKHEDNLINVLKGALKGRDNPIDLKPVYIGKIVNLSPIKVSIFEGKEENIRTGMTLTAEANVGKRRIIEFFIYPLIKYLDEGMSVR